MLSQRLSRDFMRPKIIGRSRNLQRPKASLTIITRKRTLADWTLSLKFC